MSLAPGPLPAKSGPGCCEEITGETAVVEFWPFRGNTVLRIVYTLVAQDEQRRSVRRERGVSGAVADVHGHVISGGSVQMSLASPVVADGDL